MPPPRRALLALPEAEIMREAMLTAATKRDESVGQAYLMLVGDRLGFPADHWRMALHALGGLDYLQRGRVTELLDQCRREVAIRQSVRRGPPGVALGPYRRRS
jgi:hypothetical protein